MTEFYDIYPKDRWKDPSYRLMDKFSLMGKKGFVTGGGGGIGRNVAAAWAEAGADVALVDIPASKERLEPLCKEMSERYGVKIIPLYCDVSDKAQVDKLEEDLFDCAGRTAHHAQAQPRRLDHHDVLAVRLQRELHRRRPVSGLHLWHREGRYLPDGTLYGGGSRALWHPRKHHLSGLHLVRHP